MFWVVGLAVTAFVLFRLISRLFPSKIVDLNELPRWAVVTGATDGIGQAFAQELAANGFNIVLVSRSEEKLRATAKEIEDEFCVSTKIVQADFTSQDERMYARTGSELTDLEVGVLVNNVGTTTPHPEYFVDLENHHSSIFQDIINVNIVSAINMTRFVVPGMISRGRGLVINVSSALSKFPAPMHSLYGGTKSFLTKFSQDLNIELEDKGVHVHVLTTGLVATKLAGFKKTSRTSFLGPPPSVYVRSALEDATRLSCCDGYIGHTIGSFVGTTIDLLFPDFLKKRMLKMFEENRRRTIKRCAQCNPSSGLERGSARTQDAGNGSWFDPYNQS